MTEPLRESDPADLLFGRPRRAGWLAVGIGMVFAFAIAPVLSWSQFTGGMEGLNVGTALESHREGNWLLPTLTGEPRTHKPPLASWITAVAITADVRVGLDQPDPMLRDAAYIQLAWRVRLVALLAGVVTLLCVFDIGRSLLDWRAGLVAMIVCGTSVLLLRHVRSAGYDGFLTMFAALSNAALLRAMLRHDGRWLLAAGMAIGLGILTKGPVILLQTLLPALVWAWWMQRNAAPVRVGRAWIIASTVALLAVGLPWFAYVAISESGAIRRWTVEVTREGATDLPSSSLLQYVQMIPMMTPWAILLVAGAVVIWQHRKTPVGAKLMWALLAVVLPLVVMTLFRDRKERYMLPMVIPAAVVVSAAMWMHLRNWRAWTSADRWCVSMHWTLLAIISLGVPIAGAWGLPAMSTRDGQPWWSVSTAALVVLMLSAVIGVSAWVHARRWPGGILLGTAAPMLGVFVMVMYGYASSSEGRSPLRPIIDAIRAIGQPVAVVHSIGYPERPPEEISIYLNQTIRRVGGSAEVARDDMVLITRERTRDPLAPPDERPWDRLAEAQEGRSRYGVWRLRSPEQPEPDRQPGGQRDNADE